MSTRGLRISALAAVAALTLAACGGGDDQPAAEDGYRIGITQIVSHPSLDAISQGFQDALAEAGVEATYDEMNAQGDNSTAASIAGTFAAGDYDLIFAIATPTAVAAAQAITETPIVFGAVTEPAAAGLVDSWEEPGANVTGTSDMSPVQEQLELILELDPSVETIGIVFSSKEDNSYVQSAWAEDIAKEMGLTIETATVAESADIKSAAESLDVDAYYVLTDNMVVAGVESIIEVAEARGVSVVTSDADSVERGALASYAFDYYDMGVQSGNMAIRILEGTAPADIPVETSERIYLTVNPAAAERMGITIPQSVLDRADEVLD